MTRPSDPPLLGWPEDPSVLATWSDSRLESLCADIRAHLITSVSRTGGHIGANLGVVELSVALHAVFRSPVEPIVFDTGHQGYTHRILTGRGPGLADLNRFGGTSRFLSRSESVHDPIEATHAGTALSMAMGRARAGCPHVAAVVGDGSLVEGMTWEALNDLATSGLPVVLVLNDNGYAIAPNVGGVHRFSDATQGAARCRAFFEALGFSWSFVQDGHDVTDLRGALSAARGLGLPAVVHCRTIKGKGLPAADQHPYRMHFSFAFDPATGAGASPTVAGRTHAVVAAEVLEQTLAHDPLLRILTPATPYASSLDRLLAQYPDRVIDVGMAEQHAVGLACGMALGGLHPVACLQTTFLQRAWDQILHDACFMNLPVTLLGVRHGFAGLDGPTHHGLWDIPVLRSFPNLTVFLPADRADLEQTLTRRLADPRGPWIALLPYEPPAEPEADPGLRQGPVWWSGNPVSGAILCTPSRLQASLAARGLLTESGMTGWEVGCVRLVAPFDASLPPGSDPAGLAWVAVEEGRIDGGLGGALAEWLGDRGLPGPLRLGCNSRFLPPGGSADLAPLVGVDAEGIARAVREHVQGRNPA